MMSSGLIARHRQIEIGFEPLPVAVDDALGEPVLELFRPALLLAFSTVRFSNSAIKACSGS